MKDKDTSDDTLSLMNVSQAWNFDFGGSRDPYDGDSYGYDENRDEYHGENEGAYRFAVECSFGDSDLRICSECLHKRGCLEVACGYLEHFDVADFVSSGDQDQTADDNNGNDEHVDSGVLEVSDEASRAVCRCHTSKKYHCPSCSHIESCYLRVSCSESWFHFPGHQAPEDSHQSDNKTVETSQGEITARTGVYWTPLEDEQLARLFNAGWDFADIALELQRTQRSITFRLSKLCLELNGIVVQPSSSEAPSQKQHWTADEDELLTTLFVNKSNLSVISQALKRTNASIGDRLIYLRLVAIGDLGNVKYFSGGDSSKPGFYDRLGRTS